MKKNIIICWSIILFICALGTIIVLNNLFIIDENHSKIADYEKNRNNMSRHINEIKTESQ
ncbi:MAG: hypothetical protein HY934_04940, partial [Candidatus Firestonebacteria bacterium]|nr:hypothetical protein [Candidatus Firestonebacteria bacterium]